MNETTVTGDRTVDDDGGEGVVPAAVALLVALGLLVAGLVANFAASLVVAVPLFLVAVPVDDPAFLTVTTVAGQLAFLAVGAGYLWYRGGIPVRSPTRREVGLMIGGALFAFTVAGAGSVVIGTLVTNGVIGETESALGQIVAAAPVYALLFAALSVLLVAPAEELLFRGAIQGRLRETFGPAAAIGVASLLFASIHVLGFVVVSAATVLILLSAQFVGGLVMGYAYERTGNLTVPMGIHAVYNTLAFVLAYLGTTV
jgi:membrane protease YdiL (CAAX protease family)